MQYDVDGEIWCDNCNIEPAEYEYNDNKLCGECLLGKLESEEKITTWNVKHYMFEDHEYLGNDNDNDMEEIVDNICKMLKINKIEVE